MRPNEFRTYTTKKLGSKSGLRVPHKPRWGHFQTFSNPPPKHTPIFYSLCPILRPKGYFWANRAVLRPLTSFHWPIKTNIENLLSSSPFFGMQFVCCFVLLPFFGFAFFTVTPWDFFCFLITMLIRSIERCLNLCYNRLLM